MPVGDEAERDLRRARLAERGMTHKDAQERIAAQATDEQRRAVADAVIENNGSLPYLKDTVNGLWELLTVARPGE